MPTEREALEGLSGVWGHNVFRVQDTRVRGASGLKFWHFMLMGLTVW